MNHAYNLGAYFDSINRGSTEAQSWFNRGLIWIYGFDLEMAYRCFKQASNLDPDHAMAYWGLAYSSGIYYNKPWVRMQQDELVEKLQRTYQFARKAKQKTAYDSDRESMMIDALQARYPSPNTTTPADYNRWNDEYADQMRCLYQVYPEDDDICALFAEALMIRTPWALWDLRTGDPSEGASTLEAIDVLEKAMVRREASGAIPHPGVLHLYIHVMEMSPFPEKSLRACDQLRQLVPDSGHLCHMPSHIDVRCGHYYEAIVANDKAIAADRVYLKHEGAMNYHTLSRIHNFHLKIYAAMFLGQFRTAMDAAEELIKTTPEALLRIENPAMADWMEGYIGIKAHVFIRFGRWQEIIHHPLPHDRALYCMTTAVWCYAKAIAHAVRNEIDMAKSERRNFYNAIEKVPETCYLFNNSCQSVLKIASQMLEGELAYREGNHEAAFDFLRKAVYLDDNLKYDEPWGWMQPARHALGALLLEQGYVEQAQQVYMDDLGLTDTLVSTSQHIDNLWSLHGLVECLERLGKQKEARLFRARLNLAIARADVGINASCACRLNHHCCNS